METQTPFIMSRYTNHMFFSLECSAKQTLSISFWFWYLLGSSYAHAHALNGVCMLNNCVKSKMKSVCYFKLKSNTKLSRFAMVKRCIYKLKSFAKIAAKEQITTETNIKAFDRAPRPIALNFILHWNTREISTNRKIKLKLKSNQMVSKETLIRFWNLLNYWIESVEMLEWKRAKITSSSRGCNGNCQFGHYNWFIEVIESLFILITT